MKKLGLLLILALTIVSCNDDDGVNIAYEYAPITAYDFPEFFEAGETYDLEVTYELPDACHNFVGIDGNSKEVSGGVEIYLGALTTYNPNLEVCDEEDDDLSRDRTIENFRIPTTADDGDVYTFFLLSGQDEDGDAEYTEVEIPVGAPDDEGDNTQETTEESSN
ncbi:hypothetical protein [Zunongwangia sp. H14]|uniref:hypothetical protein n=1 Tax=Zunongwangia sp. H14 TaxID=3240792 RepID=UPI003568A54F